MVDVSKFTESLALLKARGQCFSSSLSHTPSSSFCSRQTTLSSQIASNKVNRCINQNIQLLDILLRTGAVVHPFVGVSKACEGVRLKTTSALSSHVSQKGVVNFFMLHRSSGHIL